jgi:hypothetical protein
MPDMQPLYLQIVLQGLSSFAIAGGLIFTALQFRSYQKAQHVANFSKLVEMQMHLRELRIHDPELARTYAHDVKDLHSSEEIRQYFMNLMQLSVFEIVWFSFKQGQLPEDYFQSWVARFRDIATEDSFKQMMANPAMKILHDDFQRYVEGLVREVNGPPVPAGA